MLATTKTAHSRLQQAGRMPIRAAAPSRRVVVAPKAFAGWQELIAAAGDVEAPTGALIGGCVVLRRLH